MSTARLSIDEQRVITKALGVAARQYEQDAAEFKKLARFLRAGNEYPMFAPGEDGAKAADRLAEQFDKQVEQARDLLDKFSDISED